MTSKHPGFASTQSKIAKSEGVSKKAAGAILANASRNASPAAKKKNPRLKRVGGSPPDTSSKSGNHIVKQGQTY